MTDSLVHRGPDDRGEYHADRAALGHRRLSIIDLSTGRQPLANEDQTVWAVVNGEIYNFLELRDDLLARGHVFRSTSDSECLVHLYEEHGSDCVERMDGMFAFALWDEGRRLLLLGRDRLGVKPLYYRFDGSRLIFGSELKAILAAPDVPREIDPAALLDYLTFSFIPAPKTIFQDIHKLPASTVLTFQDGRVSTRRYWDLHHRGWSAEPPEVLAEQLWWRLRQATRPRLLADVPLGAFLSGGLDSAAVVAAMTQLARNDIITVTCGFEEREFDERSAALETAILLHSDHHELAARLEASEIVEELARYFDEPFADASAVPTYYLSREARRRVTVALSGDGGDEVLAGYRRYRFDCYEDSLRRWLPGSVRRALGPIAAIYPRRPWIPRPLRASATLRNLAVDAATAHGLSIATMDPGEARRLLAPDLARECRDYDPLDQLRELYHRCDARDHLSKCQYVDLRFGLAEGILTKVDRASMAHALEVRSPMLDHRFIEFAWTIPPEERIRGRAGKIPLRLAVEQQLGRGAARRPKHGFEVPLDEWFRGPLRECFRDLLAGGTATLPWLAPAEIGRAWHEHLAGRGLRGPTLWKLLMLERWRRRYLRPVQKDNNKSHSAYPPRGQAAGPPKARSLRPQL
jgi:asparagine synthase (glutamine-hydrolysing)